jgi:FkbM family methyltransferase
LALTKVNERIRGFFTGARNITQVFLRYKNWYEILAKTRKKETVNRVILRRGIQIDAPQNHPMLLTVVNETFFDKIHTLHDISIKENDVVIDIGANIGIVTIFAALSTKKTVHAFEPSPENFEFLKRNISANGLRNIEVHNVAVCDKTQNLTRLYLDKSFGNSLLSEDCPTDEYIDVPSISFQDLIDNISAPEIGFLKMDCEGSEGLIFSSTPIEYLRKVREMDVEFHDSCSPLKHDALQALMEKAGFQVKVYWPFGKNSPYGAIHAKRLKDIALART